MLLSFAGMQLLIGRQAAWVHDCWVAYFIPGLVLATGWGSERLVSSFARRTRWYSLAWCTVVGFLVILAARTALTTVELHQCHLKPTIWAEFGRAIAQNTELDDVILTSAGVSAQLRYYADRKLVGDIRSRAEFEAVLSSCGGECRYFFAPQDFPTYPQRPQMSVIPLEAVHSQAYRELLAYLQSGYESHAGDKYLMFYLRRPLDRQVQKDPVREKQCGS